MSLQSPIFIITPAKRVLLNRHFKDVWDTLIMLLTIVAAIELPLRFVLEYPNTTELKILDITLAIFFILDVIVNLIPTKPELWEQRNRLKHRIDVEYLRTWFFIDLLAAIPFGLLFAGTIHGSQAFKLLRLIRMIRLLKLVKLIPLIRRWKGYFNFSPGILRVSIFMLFIFLVCHWLACGWIVIHKGPDDFIDPVSTYVQSLYWVITTMTTIGYGDITPDLNNNIEIIYTMIIMILGVVTYGYLIGNFASMIGHFDTQRVEFAKKMNSVNSFLAYRAIPEDIQRRVRDYYHYVWENRLEMDENQMIADLPISLRTEISMVLRKTLIDKVPLFENADLDFTHDLILELDIHVYVAGDWVVREDDPGDSMFFISAGLVEVIDEEGEEDETVLAEMGPGDFFGEMSLLHREPRNATVRAREYSIIYSLDQRTFRRLLSRYPEFEEHIREVIEKRVEDEVNDKN